MRLAGVVHHQGRLSMLGLDRKDVMKLKMVGHRTWSIYMLKTLDHEHGAKKVKPFPTRNSIYDVS